MGCWRVSYINVVADDRSVRDGDEAEPSFSSDGSMSTLLARAQGLLEDEPDWLQRQGMEDDWDVDYGILAPADQVIIRPYGGDDDDIMLQELRPRFVVMYEPNLPFIRRLEVLKNCNPGLALRVYQMTYTNSFEEDRFLATMSRETEAFKKLIEDRGVSKSLGFLTIGHGHSHLQ